MKTITLDETPIIDHRGVIFYLYGYQNFDSYVLVFPYYFPTHLLCQDELRTEHAFYKKIEEKRSQQQNLFRCHSLCQRLKIAHRLGYDIIRDPRYGIPIVRLAKKTITSVFEPFVVRIEKNLSDEISAFFAIPLSAVGVGRSRLVGVNTPESNIDIIIRGKINLMRVLNRFENFLDIEMVQRMPHERLLRHISLLPNRFDYLKPRIDSINHTSFVYKKLQVDMHFVESGREVKIPKIFKINDKVQEVTATIEDSVTSFFAPYKYLMHIRSPRKYMGRKAYLMTHSKILAGVFRDGERIVFRGRAREMQVGQENYLGFTFEGGARGTSGGI